MGIFKRKIRSDIEQKINELNPKVFVSIAHIEGLPVPSGSNSQIYYCDDKIVIDSNNSSFIIDINKVQDISIKTDREIEKHIVSSTGRAIVGGMMFGIAGAAIGGRAKTKKTEIVTSNLIITYIDTNEELKCIIFNALHTPKCHEMVKQFEKIEKEKRIEYL